MEYLQDNLELIYACWGPMQKKSAEKEMYAFIARTYNNYWTFIMIYWTSYTWYNKPQGGTVRNIYLTYLYAFDQHHQFHGTKT